MTIRSHLAQPVELHLAGRTLVIAPYGSGELTAEEASAKQVRHMCEAGWLSALEEAAPAGDASAEEAPAKRAQVKRGARS